MNAKHIDKFLLLATAKYDRGQLEHGGLLTDRDCLTELEFEVIDAWFYYCAHVIRLRFPNAANPGMIRDRALAEFRDIATMRTDVAEVIHPILAHLVAIWRRIQNMRDSFPDHNPPPDNTALRTEVHHD